METGGGGWRLERLGEGMGRRRDPRLIRQLGGRRGPGLIRRLAPRAVRACAYSLRGWRLAHLAAGASRGVVHVRVLGCDVIMIRESS